tara:strand:- start:3707 stop:3922 length:216 start_codon:yes stop_codon:yes gene_type:complete
MTRPRISPEQWQSYKTQADADQRRLARFNVSPDWRDTLRARWTRAKPWANDIAKLIALSPFIYALLFFTPR